MDSEIVVDFLTALFTAHGIESTVDNGWVVPAGSSHAIGASWHPGEHGGGLDVMVEVEDDILIRESFAGFGAGDVGLQDALSNFTVNDFHVLLATFWGINDPEQVTTETWSIQGRPYTAYIGNFGTRASEGVEPCLPHGLFPALASAIQNAPLEADLHWFRFFLCNVAGAFTFESLFDNEDWEPGIEAFASLPWRSDTGYYSARLLLTLRAAA